MSTSKMYFSKCTSKNVLPKMYFFFIDQFIIIFNLFLIFLFTFQFKQVTYLLLLFYSIFQNSR